MRTPKEAEKLSDFDVLGNTRHVASQNPLFVQQHPRSSFAEMLRNIRMRIEFIVQRKSKIAITITSTQSGDGKTFMSTNFAALYAMTGRPTLLIDLDVRKPNVHEKLGVEAKNGVTNYIIGDCLMDDIIVKHPSFGFDFIPAGTIPPNPGELIRCEKLLQMIAELRQRYTYVVIDSSPVGIVPDAMSLIEQTDITLYVLRCLTTDKRFAKQTLENLEMHHKDKIALVLSDVPVDKPGCQFLRSWWLRILCGTGMQFLFWLPCLLI